MAALELRQTVETGVELRFGMRPAPSLVAFATLLALATHDLEQVVDRELELNPALERVEPDRCIRCGSVLLASGCPTCRRLHLPEDRGAPHPVPVEAIEEAVNPLTDLRRDLGTVLSSAELPLAEHVLASLDERGFLREGTQGVAAWLGVEMTRVERVVEAIRAVGPPGICAGDARECLGLQLVSRPGLVATHPILPALVEQHLDLLARGSLGLVARRLGASRDAVAAAYAALVAELRPFVLFDCSRPARSSRGAEPVGGDADIVVVDAEDGRLLVELTEPLRLGVVISPSYEQLGDTDASGADVQAARARSEVARARSFAHRLERRWRTIARVSEEVVTHQREFVLRAGATLQPLTRADVAHAVRIHESTVSRAVTGRTLLLPDGRLVSLATLFDSSHEPREALRRLLEGEGRHLSDRELSEALARGGHRVARRTVAKYRQRLGVVAAAYR